MVVDHLSRLEQEEAIEELVIQEDFPDEQLFGVEAKLPWYANFVNYLVCNGLPPELSHTQKKKFLHDVRSYLWEPLLFTRFPEKMVSRCILEEEVHDILQNCHVSPHRGHFGATRTTSKVLQARFYLPTLFRDSMNL